MKKAIGCLAVLGFIGVFVIAMLVWGSNKSLQLQREFYEAILSQNSEKVLALFHPALKAEIDEPVLQAYMKFFLEKFGAFKDINKTDFNASVNYNNGKKETKITGTVIFEKAEAKSELEYLDDQMVSFSTNSPLIKNWLTGISNSKIYQERAEKFLKAFFEKPEEAFAMSHVGLQKEAPVEKLKEMNQKIMERFGKMTAAAFQKEEFSATATPPELKLVYKLTCEKGEVQADVSFVFPGFKGSVIGFNFQ